MYDIERYDFWNRETEYFLKLVITKNKLKSKIIDISDIRDENTDYQDSIIDELFERIDIIDNELKAFI